MNEPATEVPATDSPRRVLGVCVAVLVATTAVLLPLFFPALLPLEPGLPAPVRLVCSLLALGLPVLAVAGCWRVRLELSPREKRITFGALVAATALVNDLHRSFVDEGHYPFAGAGYVDNTAWQVESQRRVMRLDPTFTGHDYRFLPNAIVHVLEVGTGSYAFARGIYRHTFMFLLVYAIYYLGRLHYAHGTALLGLLLYLAVYPVTLRHYAGQLTDPVSHLSFVLAFIFLEQRRYPYLALSILVGAIGKESVAVLAGYYALFRRDDPGHRLKAAGLLLGAAAVVVGIRLYVNSGQAEYRHMSGVPPDHVLRNLRDPRWPAQVLLSLGPFLPGFLLSWRRAPETLRGLVWFLLPVLLGSSLLFSWLREARNYVPVVIPLALITAAWLSRDPALEREAA